MGLPPGLPAFLLRLIADFFCAAVIRAAFALGTHFGYLPVLCFASTTLGVASALLWAGDVYPFFFEPFLETHFLTPIRYLPPLRLYSFTRKAFAYAEGYTLNFRFTEAFTEA